MNDRAIERLAIVGANHRSSALAVRDALFIDDPEVPLALESLRQSGMTEVVLLSTCDRVEVLLCADDPAATAAQAAHFLAQRAGTVTDDLTPHLYTLSGDQALRHLFAVGGSLDSLMIGEPHILGQLKAAHRHSRDAGLCGADLETIFQSAYGCAKRVRSETSIGEGPVSVAACAVRVAKDLFGDLSRLRLLLAGGGDMGDLIAESLQGQGLKHVTVTARRHGRAEQLARSLNAHTLPFDGLSAALVDAEIVITAIGGRTWAITEEALRAALKKRRQRPILLVDVGIPGDVETAVDRVDNAFLYSLEDLERLAEKGRAQREKTARDAWAIVEAEVDSFVQRRAERSAVPVIAALHRHFEAERARALAESHGDADKATRLLMGRLLHHPTEVLRSLSSSSDDSGTAVETLTRQLFGLGRADDCKGEDTR
jgi:glutamyl-tRNA reductase